MGRVNEPRRTINTLTREAVTGYALADGLTEDEITQSLRANDVVNSVLGIGATTELRERISDGVRELRGTTPAYRCDLCGHVFERSLMVKFKGKYYCTVHECAEEMLESQGRMEGRPTGEWPPFDFWFKFSASKTEDDDKYMTTETGFRLFVERN